MAIPDEVAQYAEGRRIVSYFSLGNLRDGDQTKNIWLWTTIGGGSHPYDFDNFRVFIWSLRHHRYETSYIERNLIGFAPVTLEERDLRRGAVSRVFSMHPEEGRLALPPGLRASFERHPLRRRAPLRDADPGAGFGRGGGREAGQRTATEPNGPATQQTIAGRARQT